MCGTSLTYPGFVGHCTGCRCFQSSDTWLWPNTPTTTVKFDTPLLAQAPEARPCAVVTI